MIFSAFRSNQTHFAKGSKPRILFSELNFEVFKGSSIWRGLDGSLSEGLKNSKELRPFWISFFFRLLRRKENIFCWFHSSLDLDTRVWFKQFVLVLKDWIKFKNGHHFLHVNPFCLCDGLHREDVHSGAMLTNIRWNYLWMLHMEAENTKFLEFIT